MVQAEKERIANNVGVYVVNIETGYSGVTKTTITIGGKK